MVITVLNFLLAVAYWFINTSKRILKPPTYASASTHSLIETVQTCITSVAETGAIPAPLLDSLDRLSHANNDFTTSLPTLHQHVTTKG